VLGLQHFNIGRGPYKKLDFKAVLGIVKLGLRETDKSGEIVV
jgi:hypothetical protein